MAKATRQRTEEFLKELEDTIRLTEGSDEEKTPLWSPLPGPQTMAFTSLADETFYGGAAGIYGGYLSI